MLRLQYLCLVTVLISFGINGKAHADATFYCESGNPSGAGAHADVTLHASTKTARIDWFSAQGRETNYLLPLKSVQTGVDASGDPVRTSTYAASGGLRFEFVQLRSQPKFPVLRRVSRGRVTELGCQ